MVWPVFTDGFQTWSAPLGGGDDHRGFFFAAVAWDIPEEFKVGQSLGERLFRMAMDRTHRCRLLIRKTLFRCSGHVPIGTGLKQRFHERKDRGTGRIRQVRGPNPAPDRSKHGSASCTYLDEFELLALHSLSAIPAFLVLHIGFELFLHSKSLSKSPFRPSSKPLQIKKINLIERSKAGPFLTASRTIHISTSYKKSGNHGRGHAGLFLNGLGEAS